MVDREDDFEARTVWIPTGRGDVVEVRTRPDGMVQYATCNEECGGDPKCGWCVTDMGPIGNWLGDIRKERLQQELKFPAPEGFNWRLALKVLVEEVGEVATEQINGDTSQTTGEAIEARDRLRAELVQVAAVACRWIEMIDGEVAANKRTYLSAILGERPR